MQQQPDFLERAKRELAAGELAGLRTYSADAERGRLLFMPIIRRMGAQVQWVSRIQIKGAIGPLPTSRASLKAIGAPDDWFDKAKNFQNALQQEFPALPEAGHERRALGEGEPERL